MEQDHAPKRVREASTQEDERGSGWSLGRLHGYGILLRIQQISGQALEIQQGALYPALYRLEHKGLIDSEWGVSENNRRAKFYRLTTSGRKKLAEETSSWNRLSEAIERALAATLQEVG